MKPARTEAARPEISDLAARTSISGCSAGDTRPSSTRLSGCSGRSWDLSLASLFFAVGHLRRDV